MIGRGVVATGRLGGVGRLVSLVVRSTDGEEAPSLTSFPSSFYDNFFSFDCLNLYVV